MKSFRCQEGLRKFTRDFDQRPIMMVMTTRTIRNRFSSDDGLAGERPAGNGTGRAGRRMVREERSGAGHPPRAGSGLLQCLTGRREHFRGCHTNPNQPAQTALHQTGVTRNRACNTLFSAVIQPCAAGVLPGATLISIREPIANRSDGFRGQNANRCANRSRTDARRISC